MAGTTKRIRKDGSTAIRITWREGGRRHDKQQSETFDDPVRAEQFRVAVELAGEHWPPGWTPGVGWEAPGPVAAPSTPVAPAAIAARETPLFDFGMTHIRDRVGITPDTRHDYQRMLTRMCAQLTPIVGSRLTVRNVREEHITRWINYRLAQPTGNSPKTIKNEHGLLAAVFNTAVRRELRKTNPCEGHRLPDWHSENLEPLDPADRALTVEEFALIVDCMLPDVMYRAEITGLAPGGRTLAREAKGVHAGTITDRRLMEVAVGTGLRWAEVTALQPVQLALDAEQPFAWVRTAWKQNAPVTSEFHDPGKENLYLGSPKSRASRRRVHLPPAVVEVLRAASHGKADSALIFTAPRGGKLRQPTWYEDRWARALDLAEQRGLTWRPRFHDLRHSHTEWQRSAGVDERQIQSQLGHSSESMTRRYGGPGAASYEALDAVMDAALGGRLRPAS